MIVIRKASLEDATLIADISRQTFYETFAEANTKEDMDKFLREQFTKGRLILEVGAKDNYFLIATLFDKVAGYIKLRAANPPKYADKVRGMEIARLYAVTSMIKKGVGKALMQAGIDMAIDKKMEMLWLGVWEKNQRAIDFYLKWGFEKFGETDFLLGNDMQKDWLMRKIL